ncbi:hypothetical protein HPB50_010958 [Hyalomma asiaticum]|uniref:Uncharacterized protein n=1 Tax=Hyalomma asiaticum TaxID=266040 RepID=A0ACB7TFX1_HYAAI|nr:hypothetical protein HPB50_010958 [Hyalomma asiaticum]
MRHAPVIRAGPTYRTLVKLARHLQIRTLPLKIRMPVVSGARYIASRPHAPLAVEPASHAAAVATSSKYAITHAEHDEDNARLTSMK